MAIGNKNRYLLVQVHSATVMDSKFKLLLNTYIGRVLLFGAIGSRFIPFSSCSRILSHLGTEDEGIMPCIAFGLSVKS